MDDYTQDMELIRPIAEEVVKLVEFVKAQGERLEMLEKVVMDDIIGGVTKLYKTNERAKGIEDLRGKYGDMLPGEDLEVFKEFYGDRDPYGDLYDMVDEMRSGEGFNEEAADARIREVLEALRGKIGKFRPKPPEAIEVEVTTSSAEGGPAEEKPVENEAETFANRIKRMKENARMSGKM